MVCCEENIARGMIESIKNGAIADQKRGNVEPFSPHRRARTVSFIIVHQ